MISRKKKALIVVVLVALAAGVGVALVLQKITETVPVVEADINARFNAVLKESASMDEVPADRVEAPERRSGRGAKESGKADVRRRAKNSSTRASINHTKIVVAGIECLTEDTCLVDRALFFAAAKNPGEYIGSARASAVRNGDNLEGFLLRHTAGGYLSALGLRDGDVLLAINGFPLTNTQNVSRAMAAALRSTQFRLDIRRGGKPMSLYYRLKG